MEPPDNLEDAVKRLSDANLLAGIAAAWRDIYIHRAYADGMSYRQIAAIAHLSPPTVGRIIKDGE